MRPAVMSVSMGLRSGIARDHSAMKRFEIITEADARQLPHSASVALTRGGHITPLAADTLRERRITVVQEGTVSADEASLVPVLQIRSVAVGSDHTGGALR